MPKKPTSAAEDLFRFRIAEAKRVIGNLCNDTSVLPETTLDALDEIAEEIEGRRAAIVADLKPSKL